MVKTEQQKRKPGPVRGSGIGRDRIKTSIEIDPDLLEWGKLHDGGFAVLVRRLLREEKQRTGKHSHE